MEGKPGWHGKALKKGEELDKALAELQAQFVPEDEPARAADAAAQRSRVRRHARRSVGPLVLQARRQPSRRAKPTATALARLGAADDRIVALDADVKNSTFSDKFEQQHPERFYQSFIAEQVMVGAAMGLAARGAIPFPSTFAAFLTPRLRLHPHGGDQQHSTSRWPARTPACRLARTGRRRWRSRIWR